MSIEETNYQDNRRTLTIIRISKCNECGYYCGVEDEIVIEGSFSHFDKNGKYLIYDKRHLNCEEHKTDHLSYTIASRYLIRKLNPKCVYTILALQADYVNNQDNIESAKYFNGENNRYWKNTLDKIKSGSKDYQFLCANCNIKKEREKKRRLL